MAGLDLAMLDMDLTGTELVTTNEEDVCINDDVETPQSAIRGPSQHPLGDPIATELIEQPRNTMLVASR